MNPSDLIIEAIDKYQEFLHIVVIWEDREMYNVITSRNSIVDELVDKYEQAGYTVKVDPANADMPDFLRGYKPDLIAVAPDKSDPDVVVEIKSPGKVRRANYWKELAEAIREQRNWRFELVVDSAAQLESMSLEEAENRLGQSEKLADNGFAAAGLLLAWTVLEAAIRGRLESARVEVRQLGLAAMIGALRNEGFLDQEEYQFLRDCVQMRHKVAHGFQEVVPSETVHTLIEAARYLLTEEGSMQSFLSIQSTS